MKRRNPWRIIRLAVVGSVVVALLGGAFMTIPPESLLILGGALGSIFVLVGLGVLVAWLSMKADSWEDEFDD